MNELTAETGFARYPAVTYKRTFIILGLDLIFVF